MRAGKWVWLAVIAVALIAVGGGGWWYFTVPHTAEAQFAYAEKLEKTLRGDAATKSGQAAEFQLRIAQVIEQYRRVGTRFGKSPKAAEALNRIAGIQETIAGDSPKAIETLDLLIKEYPEEVTAGPALMQQARLLSDQAKVLKGDSNPAANDKYKEALAKLDDYRKKFEKGKQAEFALMEIGRIWQDGLEEPLIHSIETFEKVLKDYPRSESEPEALFRLAKAYERAKEFARASALYGQLLEQYPKSKWEADALYARGKLQADDMDKHDEAAKDFQRMSQDFPDDPRSGQAAGEAKSEKTKAASEESDKYGKSRYGGNIPFDTTGDKALPPADMFKQFAAEKLDALAYDLNVEFQPKEHRITVDGTLKLTNRGDDKKDMLLMLGTGLTFSSLTVDGVAAESQHSGETVKILLPAIMKKDATSTLAFAYSGQYADAEAMAALMAATASAGHEKLHSTTAPGTERPATREAAAPATAPADPKLTFNPQMGLGEFGYGLSGASWYPITIIGDVFDAHVVIKTPANMEAVSNGAIVKRQRSTREGTDGTFEFQTKTPVFGLYFAYGPYVVQEKQVGDIHFYTYLRPVNAAKHEAYVAVANKILSFYGSKFAGFPYEKMALVDTPLPPFLGGVGPASLMFLQETMVDHPEVPETLLAHELAHQWFGNLIPINITDPNYSQWLSEGFATYCDALYTEYKDGPEKFHEHIERYDQLFFQFAMLAPKGGSAIKDIYSPASAMYRPVIYEKGALVLHMLRKVMGDDKFFALLRQYVETYRNKPSTVDDFRRMASVVHGEDLSWFFAQWIDQSVFAHWKVSAEVAASGTSFKTTVLVTQPDDLVKMPADLTLIGAKDERQVVANVMFDKKENSTDVTTPFKPVKVVVDEDNWVLKRPGSDNIWTAEKATAAR